MNIIRLNSDLFADLFFELQTFLLYPGERFLDVEDVKEFMLVGTEAANGVSQFFSNIDSISFNHNCVEVTIQLYSQAFKCKLFPDLHLSLIEKILVTSAFYSKEVILGTFESWMTLFFSSLSNNGRMKPIKIIINSGPSFDLSIVEAIKGMNNRNARINMVIRMPGILENLSGCKLDYLKLEMLFLPMIVGRYSCIFN